jgi:pyruvate dehydrogenase E2 component (dihydrolipoamide acetyltransferase)
MAAEVFMPKMSDHMEFGEIVSWLAKEGDRVEEGQGIVEIMTDKTTTEIEAPATGVLKGIREGADKGAEIPVGETFAFIAQEDEEIEPLPPLEKSKHEKATEQREKSVLKTKETVKKAQSVPQSSKENVLQPQGSVRATPAARRRAKELGMDISKVKGTGPNGMISDRDVDNFTES